MGTTRIKVIDLSSDEKEVKTSRKHAEKLASSAKKEAPKPDASQKTEQETEKAPVEETIAQNQELAKPTQPKAPKKKAATAKASHRHQGKKYKEAVKLVDKNTAYPPKEAVALLHKVSLTKFDPTVELHLNVVDKNIKGKVNFPHAIQAAKKERRHLVFSEKKIADVKNVIWADESTIGEIESGKLKPGRNFDVVITTPKFMPHLAKVAKILGPRGMMPNPKNGTITDDPTKILSGETDSAYEYRTDPTAPVLHTKIGKLSYKDEALVENLKALVLSVGPAKIKKATLSSSMSPSITIDITAATK
jgi:large subunit ribosomal protein L1